jgi:preprotein translocase subunit SecF
MEWIKPGTNYDFMRASKFWVPFSVVISVASLALILIKGFDTGIDFKGGTKVIAEFKRSANVDHGAIKKVVDDLVAKQTGVKGTQVEVQDFDVGATASGDTVKYQIFTELPSLLTPIRKLEIGKDVETYFGKGTVVESPFEAGDKFYVLLPADWPIDAAKAELTKVFAKADYANVSIKSDKEERVLTDLYRELDVLRMARDEEVKAEAAKVKSEADSKIKDIQDNRFTVEVQAIRYQMQAALKDTFGDGFGEVVSAASVSPSVGRDLFDSGMIALGLAILMILIYMAIRFDMRFAPGAILCLVHDVVVVMGVMSLLEIKFTLPIVASILTCIGYDINDTIVVYDRIRENLQKGRGGDLRKTINISINETLSRTIMTSGVTELTVVSIWLLGGGTIEDFAFTLFIGIILGTYSSIFVASPLSIVLDRFFRRRAAAAKA